MRPCRYPLLCSLVLLGWLPAWSLQGGQVDWASSAFSVHVTSDDSPLDASFLFELGAFADGFVPTSENTAEWAAHWRVAQRASYHAENQLFAASHVMETNESPFGTADQGYIWGLSSRRPGEWILLTSPAWTWPAAGGADPPVVWTVGNSETRVVGEVNPSGDPYFLRTGAVDPASPTGRISGPAWREARFTSAQIADGTADWTADADGDGRTNLTEMGAGSDPLVPDKGLVPQVRITSQDTLELSVDKVPGHLIDYQVEVSGDLVTWTRDPAQVDVVTDSASRLVVRDRMRLTGLQRRFIRLTFVVDD